MLIVLKVNHCEFEKIIILLLRVYTVSSHQNWSEEAASNISKIGRHLYRTVFGFLPRKSLFRHFFQCLFITNTI